MSQVRGKNGTIWIFKKQIESQDTEMKFVYVISYANEEKEKTHHLTGGFDDSTMAVEKWFADHFSNNEEARLEYPPCLYYRHIGVSFKSVTSPIHGGYFYVNKNKRGTSKRKFEKKGRESQKET